MTSALVTKALRDELFGFIRRRVRDDDVADDLTQELFLRLARQQAEPDSEAPQNLRALLHRMARNLVIDHYRRGSAPTVELVDVPVVAPPEVTEARRLEACLRGFLPQLGAQDQAALEAVDWQGQSQEAWAQEQGLSSAGARSRVQRARRRLRQRLGSCCEVEQLHGRVSLTGRCQGRCGCSD